MSAIRYPAFCRSKEDSCSEGDKALQSALLSIVTRYLYMVRTSVRSELLLKDVIDNSVSSIGVQSLKSKDIILESADAQMIDDHCTWDGLLRVYVQ